MSATSEHADESGVVHLTISTESHELAASDMRELIADVGDQPFQDDIAEVEQAGSEFTYIGGGKGPRLDADDAQDRPATLAVRVEGVGGVVTGMEFEVEVNARVWLENARGMSPDEYTVEATGINFAEVGR